jgi:hypothetical protein
MPIPIGVAAPAAIEAMRLLEIGDDGLVDLARFEGVLREHAQAFASRNSSPDTRARRRMSSWSSRA